MAMTDLVQSINSANRDGNSHVDKAQVLVTSAIQLQLLLWKLPEPTSTR